MRMSSYPVLCGLVAAASLLVCESAAALSMPTAVLASDALASPNNRAGPIEIGGRWYDDDDYYDRYPPPPVTYYRVPPLPPPVVYSPPVYGWYYAVPIRPANCGRYRYWNGDRCADARYDPPYVGPRW